jgi:Putative Flp pilus-assembly TadE/G-like
MVIFALSVTVLLGLAGLSIDAMRAYDLYAREERAAEAAALAGVIYMPCFYNSTKSASFCSNSTSPGSQTAVGVAYQQVKIDGFPNAAAPKPAPGEPACTDEDTSAEVTVCQVTGHTNALRVTITEPITLFFLSMVGARSINVSATGAADYLSTYVLGANPSNADSNAWGDGGSTHPKHWVATINGPAEYKEEGDPFVNCEEGPSQGPMDQTLYQTSYNGADENQGSATSTYYTLGNSGQTTNHPQYTSVGGTPKCGNANLVGSGGNSDYQPTGFTGEATKNDTTHPGGYNYAIAANSGGADVWIYNPGFDPTDPSSSCQGAQVLDRFPVDVTCNVYFTNYGSQITLNNINPGSAYLDDPRLYFNVSYSLYPTTATSVTGQTAVASVTYPPLDTIGLDLSRHGCATAYDLSNWSYYSTSPSSVQPGSGCIASSDPRNYAYQWEKVGTLPSQGLYRLAVEATPYVPPTGNPNPSCTSYWSCGWGRHTYSILVCPPGSTPPSGDTCAGGGSGGAISAWNNIDIYLNFPSSTTTAVNDVSVPLAYITGDFAGRSITIGIYDPGDSHGTGDDSNFMIVPPDPCISKTFTYGSGSVGGQTNWVRTSNYPVNPPPNATSGTCPILKTSILTSYHNGSGPSDNLYNGLWILTTINLPATYTGGQWWLDEHSYKGKNFDQFAVKINLNGGTPIHLIL